LAEFGFGEYLIVPFLVRFGAISGSFGLAIVIWLDYVWQKYRRTMAWTNLRDMPSKRTKKV